MIVKLVIKLFQFMILHVDQLNQVECMCAHVHTGILLFDHSYLW